MQLSRVAIAAVFFVVGALIVIPMLTNSSSPSRASSSTSPSASVSATKSASPTRSRTPTHKPPAKPTHSTSSPTATPATPLTATVSAVRCPGRTVQVTVTNTGSQTEDYAITTDGSISVADRIPAKTTRKTSINVKEDRTTTIAVTLRNVPVKTVDRKANCSGGAKDQALPHTGPGDGLIYARVATGIGAMLTGAIIFWYGRLWPRRRDKMFD